MPLSVMKYLQCPFRLVNVIRIKLRKLCYKYSFRKSQYEYNLIVVSNILLLLVYISGDNSNYLRLRVTSYYLSYYLT